MPTESPTTSTRSGRSVSSGRWNVSANGVGSARVATAGKVAAVRATGALDGCEASGASTKARGGGDAVTAKTPTTRTHATAGVSTRGQTFRKEAPRRIGSSTKWNDANAIASVVARRNASNGAKDRPVRSGDNHRKIGQWNR